MNKVFYGILAAFMLVLNAKASDKADVEKAWKKQLHTVMQESPSDSLVLISYKEKKEITSERKLLTAVESVFADDSYIAVSNLADNSYVIVPMNGASHLWNGYTKLKEEVYAKAATILFGGATLRLIELKWKYKGTTCVSRALVSDEEGLLFETIGYFVLIK